MGRTSEQTKRSQLKLIKRGLCIWCRQKSKTRFCKKCKVKVAASVKRLRKGRIKKGLCERCGEKLDRVGTYCVKCCAIRMDLYFSKRK